jgi:hypothetical protein
LKKRPVARGIRLRTLFLVITEKGLSANARFAAIVEGNLGVERNGLNIKAVDIAEFAKIVKIVEPATDMTGARFAFGIFIYQ